MWGKWGQQYSDDLSVHVNGLNLYVNEHTSITINRVTSPCKNKAKPYRFISNHKQRP